MAGGYLLDYSDDLAEVADHAPGPLTGVHVLVVNAGSQSVKLRVIGEADEVLAGRDLGPPDDKLASQLADFLDEANGLDVVGHRVVHGGDLFTEPVVVDDRVRADLAALSELAPLHNPPALVALDAARRLLPGVKSVACFDTAFHAGLRPEAASYALPAEWVKRWGIRKYGFHGISCAWASRRAASILGRPPGQLRLVVCHLGGGASVTAVDSGRSVDTTMGFTPLEGLVMATRSGDVDPGAVLWVLDRGLTTSEATTALEHQAGLLGLSGGRTSDMRELLSLRAGGDEEARVAVSVYLHRLRAKISAMVASMSGVDAVVFTGGVGEGSPTIRAETCAGLGWLGVSVDASANIAAGEDRDISARAASVRCLVVHAREDLEIARQCRQLVGADGNSV